MKHRAPVSYARPAPVLVAPRPDLGLIPARRKSSIASVNALESTVEQAPRATLPGAAPGPATKTSTPRVTNSAGAALIS